MFRLSAARGLGLGLRAARLGQTPSRSVSARGRRALASTSSAPATTRWLQRVRDIDVGVVALNVGMSLQLVGMGMSDMLELRVLSLIGGAGTIAYYFLHTPRLLVSIVWGSAFGVLNLYHIALILYERRPVIFTEQEAAVYDFFFSRADLAPRQILKILALGEHRQLPAGTVLTVEGELNPSVHLLCKGTLHVSVDGRAKGLLAAGDRGAVIGDVSFFEHVRHAREAANADADVAMAAQEGSDARTGAGTDAGAGGAAADVNSGGTSIGEAPLQHASATVVAHEDVVVATFDIRQLRALFHVRPDLQRCWRSLCSDAVVAKLLQRNANTDTNIATFHEVLETVLCTERVTQAQKQAVEACRQRLFITRPQQDSALAALGWSAEEYANGRLGSPLLQGGWAGTLARPFAALQQITVPWGRDGRAADDHAAAGARRKDLLDEPA